MTMRRKRAIYVVKFLQLFTIAELIISSYFTANVNIYDKCLLVVMYTAVVATSMVIPVLVHVGKAFRTSH
jgi:hypothetical protein